MFRKIVTFLLLGFLFNQACAQQDTSVWLRAFPVTSYMVDLNDSVKVVQLELPESVVIKEKQSGVLYGKYDHSKTDAVEKGYGRCHLIKGNFYYFTIGHNTSGIPAKEGDLLYVRIPATAVTAGRAPQLAAHFIRLQDVYEKPYYDRYLIFNGWSAENEKAMVDSMVADIRFTGDYFLQLNPQVNETITKGVYAGKKILELMSVCKTADLEAFLDYMIAKPRIYAGAAWKIAEIFATWVTSGAPGVIKKGD